MTLSASVRKEVMGGSMVPYVIGNLWISFYIKRPDLKK